ncbi:MAG: biopolymer transporter ExbD [Pyrinomonadaceae bacterium]
MIKPQINVTPLIDVLLVLLIIFMVVTPLKPSSFKTRVPSEPTEPITPVTTNPKTILVTVGRDSSLSLNTETGLGTTAEPDRLINRLREIFNLRIANRDVSESFADLAERPFDDRIERTVFMKAPRTMSYGSVTRVVDAVKIAGAFPISLQIDDLN